MHRRGLQQCTNANYIIGNTPSTSTAKTLVVRRHRSEATTSRARKLQRNERTIEQWTSQLARHASRGETSSGYKFATSRRGAEERLNAAIARSQKQEQHPALVSANKVQFSAELPQDGIWEQDGTTSSRSLHPGTFVEMRRCVHH
jgi:hypothetical protein